MCSKFRNADGELICSVAIGLEGDAQYLADVVDGMLEGEKKTFTTEIDELEDIDAGYEGGDLE